MRTTITIDEDVALMLRKLQTEQKKPFKQVINEVLRRGLVREKSRESTAAIYATPVLSGGALRYPDLDNTAEALAVAEREDFK